MNNARGPTQPTTALLLSGGGARAAYQVGVLKGMAEILPSDGATPFNVICGTSAGSINATVLASGARDFHQSVVDMVNVWSNFSLDQVFRTDSWSLLKRFTKWAWSTLGPGDEQDGPVSLLDNSPLCELLADRVNFQELSDVLDDGVIDALCVNACSYSTGRSISFFQGKPELAEWDRAHRSGRRRDIRLDHLIASASIPVVFPPIMIDGEYFGDGSMRQNAPTSPALHLGAKKILVIGVRMEPVVDQRPAEGEVGRPTVGQIAGYIMDTLFLNSLHSDIERLERINRMLKIAPYQEVQSRLKLTAVDHLVISPSADIADVSTPHFEKLPRVFRFAIRLLGMHKGNSRRFVSYLMFNRGFCSDLIDLGYRDAMAQREEIERFMGC